MTIGPSFPPLMHGFNVAGADPFEAALAEAIAGCDAGTIYYDIMPEQLRAAIVFAPEVPLAKSAAMLPLTGVAVQNALGALGPAELPVHLDWRGPIRVNGAVCGALKAAADTPDPTQTPAYLVTGFSLVFDRAGDGGETPDQTALVQEGCGDLDPVQFIESWSRHLLNWVNRWEEDGIGALHREYAGLVYGMGDEITVGDQSGIFLGLDEELGLLLKTGNGTIVLPVSSRLETRT